MFDDGEAQTGAAFFGGVIRLENPLDLVGRNAGAIVAHGNFDRIIAVAIGRDKHIAFLAQRFAGIFQKVHENFRQMAALHQQWRKIVAVFAVDLNARRHRGRKHLRDGAIEFRDDIQFFDMAFAQLRVTHDLGDDLVGARDFLLNDFDLLRDFGLGRRAGSVAAKTRCC